MGCSDFLIIQSTSGVSRLATITLAAVWGSRGIPSMVYGFDTLADGDPGYKTSLIFLTTKEAAWNWWLCTGALLWCQLSPFAFIFISVKSQVSILCLQTNMVGYSLTCIRRGFLSPLTQPWGGNISATYAAGPKLTFTGKIVFLGNAYVSDLSSDESWGVRRFKPNVSLRPEDARAISDPVSVQVSLIWTPEAFPHTVKSTLKSFPYSIVGRNSLHLNITNE